MQLAALNNVEHRLTLPIQQPYSSNPAQLAQTPSLPPSNPQQFNATIYYICSDNKAHEFVASLPPAVGSPQQRLPSPYPTLPPCSLHVAECPCTAICAQQQQQQRGQQQLLQQTATVVGQRVISFTQTYSPPPLPLLHYATALLIHRKPALTATVPN